MRTGQLTAIHVNSAFRLHRDVAHLRAKMMRERSPADMWRRHPANQSPAHCEICSEGKSPRGLIRICPGHMYVYAHNLLINVIAAHVGGDPSSLRGGSICLPSLSTAEAGCFFFVCVLSLNLPVSRVNQKHGPTSGEWIGEKKKITQENDQKKRNSKNFIGGVKAKCLKWISLLVSKKKKSDQNVPIGFLHCHVGKKWRLKAPKTRNEKNTLASFKLSIDQVIFFTQLSQCKCGVFQDGSAWMCVSLADHSRL